MANEQPVTEQQPTDAAATVETVVDTPVEGATTETPVETAKVEEPKQNHAQRRHDRMLRERAEFRAKAEYLEAELNRLKAPVAPANVGPTREMFADENAYIDAVVEYKLSSRLPAAVQQATRAMAVTPPTVDWDSRTAALAEEHADYDEAIEVAQRLAIPSKAHEEAISTSEVGPELVYYFGKNPAEARRIMSLPATAAAREIGKIEVKLSKPAATKTVTRAPAPVTPIGAGNAAADAPLDTIDSLSEFQARRRAMLTKKRY